MNAESNFQTFQKSIPWHQTTPIDPMAEAVDRDLLTGPNLPIISATHHDKSATAGKWIQFSLLQPYTASLHHTTFTESRLILLSINGSLVNYEAANIHPSQEQAHICDCKSGDGNRLSVILQSYICTPTTPNFTPP